MAVDPHLEQEIGRRAEARAALAPGEFGRQRLADVILPAERAVAAGLALGAGGGVGEAGGEVARFRAEVEGAAAAEGADRARRRAGLARNAGAVGEPARNAETWWQAAVRRPAGGGRGQSQRPDRRDPVAEGRGGCADAAGEARQARKRDRVGEQALARPKKAVGGGHDRPTGEARPARRRLRVGKAGHAEACRQRPRRTLPGPVGGRGIGERTERAWRAPGGEVAQIGGAAGPLGLEMR